MKIKKIINWKTMLVMVAIAGIIPLASFSDDDDDDFELVKNLEIFHTLMRNIRIMYVEETSSGELIKTAMDKMLESLDPYTVYYPESLVEDVMFMRTGEYAGIGANLEKIKNDYVIGDIYKDSPADKAGLWIGDKILKINDKTVNDKSYEDLEIILKGEPGTSVSVQYDRFGEKKTATMKRAMINVPDIPYYGEIADKTGYINLSGFTQNCSRQFKDAFMKLKTENKIDKLIIDLRYNPGGLLIEAVNLVNIFVNKGETIVDMRGRVSEWNKIFKTENNAIDTEIPIVVLVNGNSASAAEIVSGSLQDLDRAVIVGEKTYGKGLVQTTQDLVFGSKMKVTTAKYYIPSGRCIQKLDYGHKDSIGKATRISESVNKVFKTKNGRPVKDAGGILPDIEVNGDTMSFVLENLIDNNIIFDYATQYRAKHSTIEPADKFKITDKEISELKEFAGNNLYQYKTQSENCIEELETSLREEFKDIEAENALKAIKSQILGQKQKEFAQSKRQIETALGSEIVRRYYYDEGVIKHTLKQDQYIEQALRVLNDAVLYKKILSGK